MIRFTLNDNVERPGRMPFVNQLRCERQTAARMLEKRRHRSGRRR